MACTVAFNKEQKTMMNSRFTFDKLGLYACCLLFLALLSGCASHQKTDDDVVVERAQARWDAITGNELEEAYTYYSPGYRSSTSLFDFGVGIRSMRVLWTAAEYMDHHCEETRCTVRFNVSFRVNKPVPGLKEYNGKQVIEDTWIKTQGNWWYLPNK